jgi:hypothetical protein
LLTPAANLLPVPLTPVANLQTDAAQLLILGPIPAKAKKLGLLSIYKFSLGVSMYVHGQ